MACSGHSIPVPPAGVVAGMGRLLEALESFRFGPGELDWRTPEATARLAGATDLVGYRTYLRQVGPIADHQTCHSFNNRHEAARAAFALDLAAGGRDVVVVSSGDPGIFAMATAVIEELHRENASGRWQGVVVTIVPDLLTAFQKRHPGIFVVLSDLLTDIEPMSDTG